MASSFGQIWPEELGTWVDAPTNEQTNVLGRHPEVVHKTLKILSGEDKELKSVGGLPAPMGYSLPYSYKTGNVNPDSSHERVPYTSEERSDKSITGKALANYWDAHGQSYIASASARTGQRIDSQSVAEEAWTDAKNNIAQAAKRKLDDLTKMGYFNYAKDPVLWLSEFNPVVRGARKEWLKQSMGGTIEDQQKALTSYLESIVYYQKAFSARPMKDENGRLMGAHAESFEIGEDGGVIIHMNDFSDENATRDGLGPEFHLNIPTRKIVPIPSDVLNLLKRQLTTAIANNNASELFMINDESDTVNPPFYSILDSFPPEIFDSLLNLQSFRSGSKSDNEFAQKLRFLAMLGPKLRGRDNKIAKDFLNLAFSSGIYGQSDKDKQDRETNPEFAVDQEKLESSIAAFKGWNNINADHDYSFWWQSRHQGVPYNFQQGFVAGADPATQGVPYGRGGTAQNAVAPFIVGALKQAHESGYYDQENTPDNAEDFFYEVVNDSFPVETAPKNTGFGYTHSSSNSDIRLADMNLAREQIDFHIMAPTKHSGFTGFMKAIGTGIHDFAKNVVTGQLLDSGEYDAPHPQHGSVISARHNKKVQTETIKTSFLALENACREHRLFGRAIDVSIPVLGWGFEDTAPLKGSTREVGFVPFWTMWGQTANELKAHRAFGGSISHQSYRSRIMHGIQVDCWGLEEDEVPFTQDATHPAYAEKEIRMPMSSPRYCYYFGTEMPDGTPSPQGNDFKKLSNDYHLGVKGEGTGAYQVAKFRNQEYFRHKVVRHHENGVIKFRYLDAEGNYKPLMVADFKTGKLISTDIPYSKFSHNDPANLLVRTHPSLAVSVREGFKDLEDGELMGVDPMVLDILERSYGVPVTEKGFRGSE